MESLTLKKEQFAFLVVGFAFGILVGYGAFMAHSTAPDLEGQGATASAAQGSAAPAAGPADGGAPMMAEIRGLKKRVQDNPQDHEALVRLANLYHDGNMLDDAISYYEKALAVEPNSPDELTDMGICYRAKREYERALELFQQANKIDPAHWQSLFNYVVVAGFDLGHFDSARQALDTMEKMNPRPPRLDDLRKALEQAATAAASAGASG